MDAPTFAWPPPSGKSGEKEKEEENGEGKGEKFSGHIAIFFQHACRTEVFDPSNSKNSLCLEFSDLCKSAMVNKEWREAIKSTLPLLKTLLFTFLPKE